MYYPPSWRVESEDSDSVKFDAPVFAWARVTVSSQVRQNSRMRRADDDEQRLLALADAQANAATRGGLDFILLQKSVKDYGVYEGYVIESKTYDDIYDAWAARIHVTVLFELEGFITANYGRAGTERL